MAQLILSDAEKRELPLLAWDDESLGMAVKRIASILHSTDGQSVTKFTAAGAFLISAMLENNAKTLNLNLDELKVGETSLGNFKITIEEIEVSHP